VNDSRATDLWSGLLVISDCNDKLKITMKISDLFVGLAEYSAISREAVNRFLFYQEEKFKSVNQLFIKLQSWSLHTDGRLFCHTYKVEISIAR
jgi:hypothetical protein